MVRAMENLVALLLAIWSLIHPRLPKLAHANEIAVAIVDTLEEERRAGKTPVYDSWEQDAAVQAYFAFRESTLDPHANGDCRHVGELATCAAHGVWQLHGACGKLSVEEQARCWRAMLRSSPCKVHPAAIMWGACSGQTAGGRAELLGAQREKKARELLEQARGVALAQAP